MSDRDGPARQRQSIVINRLTGEITRIDELLPDASFAERAAALKASAELGMIGRGPVEARFFHVRCDGCGITVEVDWDRPQIPAGWVTVEAGELCPACQGPKI